jgi:hypothetical protein
VLVAVVLSASAALAAGEAIFDRDGRATTAVGGLPTGVGRMALQARLESVADDLLLMRTASSRGRLRVGALALGMFIALAAARRATVAPSPRPWRRSAMVSASSRAPPGARDALLTSSA